MVAWVYTFDKIPQVFTMGNFKHFKILNVYTQLKKYNQSLSCKKQIKSIVNNELFLVFSYGTNLNL